MANLDLEEQEQLDQLRHFWKQYGNLITWALILVLGGFAAYNGWQYWQRNQAAQAAALYDEVDRAAQSGDAARVERAYNDIKDRFGGTAYAQQAALLAARTLAEQGKADVAEGAMRWVLSSTKDEGYKAVARLRLAGLLAERKAYDEALQQVAGDFPKEFAGLAADRRGDILSLQGKRAEARDQYVKAWEALGERADYRQLVEFKLTALGVDPQSLKGSAAPAAAPASAAKP